MLKNPTSSVARERVMADLDADVFNFFFAAEGDSVFCHTRGARAALIAQFFHALKKQCELESVPSHWEPGNEDRVQHIMDRLNFNETKISHGT